MTLEIVSNVLALAIYSSASTTVVYDMCNIMRIQDLLRSSDLWRGKITNIYYFGAFHASDFQSVIVIASPEYPTLRIVLQLHARAAFDFSRNRCRRGKF